MLGRRGGTGSFSSVNLKVVAEAPSHVAKLIVAEAALRSSVSEMSRRSMFVVADLRVWRLFASGSKSQTFLLTDNLDQLLS